MNRSGRGLSVPAALAAGPAVALGFGRFGYALLLPSMRADLHWSYATAGAMGTANSLGYLAGALAAAPVARLGGSRRMFGWSTGLTGLSLLACAGTGGTAVLLVLRAAAGVLGAVAFTTGAGLAARAGAGAAPRLAAAHLTIYVAGAGAGIAVSGAAVPWLLGALPAAAGWRAGWVVLGLLSLASLAVALPVLRSCGEPAVPGAADGRWPVARLAALCCCYGLFGLGYIAYMTFVVAYLRGDGDGAGLITAFWVVLGVASAAGAFGWVPVIARLRGGRAPGLIAAVVAAGALLPLASRSPAAALASAVLFGASFLSVVASVLAVARRSVAPWHASSAIAAMTVVVAIGQSAGPVLSGALSDGKAGLGAGLGVSAAILVASALVALAQPHHETGLQPVPRP